MIEMNEKVKLALERLTQNEAVMADIKQNPPKSKEDLIALAKRLDVELSESDLTSAHDLSDLTEEELKQAAGGDAEEVFYLIFCGLAVCTAVVPEIIDGNVC